MTTIRQATATALCNLLGSAGLLLEGAAEALQPLGQPAPFDMLTDSQALALAKARTAIDTIMELLATIQADVERREYVRADDFSDIAPHTP